MKALLGSRKHLFLSEIRNRACRLCSVPPVAELDGYQPVQLQLKLTVRNNICSAVVHEHVQECCGELEQSIVNFFGLRIENFDPICSHMSS